MTSDQEKLLAVIREFEVSFGRFLYVPKPSGDRLVAVEGLVVSVDQKHRYVFSGSAEICLKGVVRSPVTTWRSLVKSGQVGSFAAVLRCVVYGVRT